MVILDTSVLIDSLRQSKNHDSILREFIILYPKDKLAISVLTIQELYAGKSSSDLKKEKSTEEATDPLGGIKVATENPLQAIKSIFAITNADIREMLEAIHEKGIGISVIHGVEDRAFPMAKMQEVINPKHVDGFYSVKGLHGAYMFEPKLYTPAVDKALDVLEKKSKTK